LIVAKSHSTVLLRGESGTGKELIAKGNPRAVAPRQGTLREDKLRGAAGIGP